jgi:hypothetical protein
MSLVFLKGEWISVPPPAGHDPSWTASDKWLYATTFAAAQESGFSEERSQLLAEAQVHKRVYPGLMYSKAIEADLLRLLG